MLATSVGVAGRSRQLRNSLAASSFQYVTAPAGRVNPTSFRHWKSTDVMGAVFVAHDNGDGDHGVGERPACSSVSESSASRRFRTR